MNSHVNILDSYLKVVKSCDWLALPFHTKEIRHSDMHPETDYSDFFFFLW
jgi:hypothetical protein